MTFQQKLDAIIKKNNSLLCIGLDSSVTKVPGSFQKKDYPQFSFNKWIIEQTHKLVCAYKPNSAFYEARGADGITELKMTCRYLVKHYPEIPIILDAKRGDIGSSNEEYIKYAFDYLGADAITLHPYLGKESLQPFFDLEEKGCIIMCRNTNPGAHELQTLIVNKKPFYLLLADKVINQWNTNGNCILLMSATVPEDLAPVRALSDDMLFLIPGVGVQEGLLEKTVKNSINSKGKGIIINAGRSIIFATNPQKEAIKLRDEINKFR